MAGSREEFFCVVSFLRSQGGMCPAEGRTGSSGRLAFLHSAQVNVTDALDKTANIQSRVMEPWKKMTGGTQDKSKV